jgi:SanA protein
MLRFAALSSSVKRAHKLALVACGVVASGIAGSFLASAWLVRRAAPHMHRDLETVPARSVVIVPGCRVHDDGTPSATLEDRLAGALELYEAGKVERVLVSGDHSRRAYDEVGVMQRWLVERGVPDEDVFSDHAGLRTLDTMERAARVFEVRDAIISTQEFHLPRSIFLAREAGIDAVGYVADRRVYSARRTDAARERLAHVKALLDVYVLGTEPRHLGEPIPITTDARVTQRLVRAGRDQGARANVSR